MWSLVSLSSQNNDLAVTQWPQGCDRNIGPHFFVPLCTDLEGGKNLRIRSLILMRPLFTELKPCDYYWACISSNVVNQLCSWSTQTSENPGRLLWLPAVYFLQAFCIISCWQEDYFKMKTDHLSSLQLGRCLSSLSSIVYANSFCPSLKATLQWN